MPCCWNSVRCSSAYSIVFPLIAATVVMSAWAPPATSASPGDDLSVTFKRDSSLPAPGGITGTITNNSAQNYECVELVFRLVYHKGAKGPAEQRVRVYNASARSVTEYSAPLQQPVGFGLSGIEVCSEDVATPPVPQQASRDCVIKGTVRSETHFIGIDDLGKRQSIEKVYLLASNGKLVAEGPLWPEIKKVHDQRTNRSYESRDYDFARLPEGKAYTLRLGSEWISKPSAFSFSCPDERGRHEFEVKPFEHTGNRLGG